MASAPLIFIHSSFRTGSTWFQSRFRQNEAFCTYTEIFNEHLASCRLDNLHRIDHASWSSRHPPSIPYFAEYAPLFRDNGQLEGFRREFAFERYFPSSTDSLPSDEYAYVSSLIETARKQGKIPVLTCTRSIGRITALKKAFGGFHIFLYRDLFNQWCSYTELAVGGNRYFLDTVDMIIKSSGDERLKSICAVFNTGTTTPQDSFTFVRFCLLHLFLYQMASDACDFPVFMGDLSLHEIRSELEKTVHSLTGQMVSFSGYRENQQISFIDIEPQVLSEAIAMFVVPRKGDIELKQSGILEKSCETLLSSFSKYRQNHGPLLKSYKALFERFQALEAHLQSVQSERNLRTTELSLCQAELARIRQS